MITCQCRSMPGALEHGHDHYNVKVRTCDRAAQAHSSDAAFGLLVCSNYHRTSNDQVAVMRGDLKVACSWHDNAVVVRKSETKHPECPLWVS